jgi:orotate phosphoribosyltransferase
VRDWSFEVVCGPATGGLVVAEWLAKECGTMAVFAEHDGSSNTASGGALRAPFVLKRGYDRAVADRAVLVVDDIVNTGHSIRQTAAAVRAAAGRVIGAAAYITRGNVGAPDLGVDAFRYLLEYRVPAWPAAACELCARGVPINTRHAHGAEFVAAARRSP